MSESPLEKIQHWQKKTLTFERILNAEGWKNVPALLALGIKIRDRKYKGSEDSQSERYKALSVEKRDKTVIVDRLLGEEVKRGILSQGIYRIPRAATLIIWWIREGPIKIRVGVPCTQTRFEEGISATLNLHFKPLSWRRFTDAIHSYQLIKRENLWEELKILLQHAFERFVKQRTGKIQGVSLEQLFHQTSKSEIKQSLKKYMQQEFNKNKQTFTFLEYYMSARAEELPLESLNWSSKACRVKNKQLTSI